MGGVGDIFGGGSSGGGGGGSGKVDYPDHMKDFHKQTLDHDGVDIVTSSITDIINSSLGNSPWLGVSAYDPDDSITSMMGSVDNLETMVDLLSSGTSLDSLISSILDQTRIDNAVDAYSDDLSDKVLTDAYPRLEGGMRDINAVVSSAFAISKGIIEAKKLKQVALYSAELNMKAFSDDAIRVIGLKLEGLRMVTHYSIESNRLKIVAKKEENDYNINIDENDARWDIELYQHAGNFLASIGGGTAVYEDKERSKSASAIGGAMTGAAAGAQIGGPYGAIVGGVLGAAASFI